MKKKILTLILAASLSIVYFAGCAGSDESSDSSQNSNNEAVTVNIGEQNEYMFSYAQELGIVDEVVGDQNIEFNVTFFTSGPNMNDAYAAGDLDFATMGVQPALSGASSGKGYHIFARTASTENNSPLIAAVDSGIESIEDLKGKKVGTYVGGTWQYYLSLYLESVGLSEDDVELFNTASETATAIRSGEVDAAVIGLSTAYILEDEGSANIIADDGTGVDAPSAITARDEFVEENPEATKIVTEIYKKTLEAINEDIDSYSEYTAEKQGLDSEFIIKANRDIEYKYELDEEDISELELLFDFMIKNDLASDTGEDFHNLFNTDIA